MSESDQVRVTSTEQQLRDLAYTHSFAVELLLSPEAWQTFSDQKLSWEKLSFPPNPRNLVPKRPGVYAFVVDPGFSHCPPSTAFFYVGKATNLYSRLSEYLYELESSLEKAARPHIWRMVNQWRGHLSYYYVTLPSVELAEALENEMKESLRPPFNKDYPATISKSMRAF